MKLRLFIAMPLGYEVEQALGGIIADLQKYNDPVRWVKPSHIHLTLRFLGDTDKQVVPKISDGLAPLAARYAPHHLRIETLGAFPNARRPRVIWAGFRTLPPTLVGLAEEVERMAQALHFPAEPKVFRPHLTLGRVKEERSRFQPLRVSDALASYQIDPIPLVLDRLILFESTLTPAGPNYKPLWSDRLASSR